jgi:putative peptidoglycan lipid II flippase
LLIIPALVVGYESAERIVGSVLGTSVVAATEFANYVADTALLLVAMPIGLSGLLALRGGVGGSEEAKEQARRAIPVLLFLSVPVSVVLSIRSVDLVTLLYARGEFNSASVAITAELLSGFAVGLWGQVVGFALLKVFSANLQIRALVAANATGLAVGLLVMLLALYTRDPYFIGLGGAASGVTTTLISSRILRVIGVLGRWCLSLAPGIAALVVLDWSLPVHGRLGGVLILVATVLLWSCFGMTFGPIRDQVRTIVRRLSSRRVG